MTMKYRVELHPSEEGIAVSCPDLPGCWSQGDTEDEALDNIRIAIEEYLAAQDELARPSRRTTESRIEAEKSSDIREVEVVV